MDLSKLGEAGIKDNLESYIQGFSKDAREIFEHFKFAEFIGQLDDANLLYKIVQQVRKTDLSPKAISNHEMGLVFEELIRRFAESSNETAGEHFTPRDIVRLTTSLVFMEDAKIIIEELFENYDGSGIPSGKKSHKIMLPSRILRIVGDFLAFKNMFKMNNSDIINYMEKSAGKEYDPEILKIFFDLVIKH